MSNAWVYVDDAYRSNEISLEEMAGGILVDLDEKQVELVHQYYGIKERFDALCSQLLRKQGR